MIIESFVFTKLVFDMFLIILKINYFILNKFNFLIVFFNINIYFYKNEN